MMLYPAMNELLKQVPSRYKLVNVVAARARHIASEAERDEIKLEDKPVSIAIREIAEGKFSESEPELEQELEAARETEAEAEAEASEEVSEE